MERSLARSGAQLQMSRIRDNQDGDASDSSTIIVPSCQDRGREIVMRLLEQITAFLERKERMSTCLAASHELRHSRSRRHQYNSSSNNNLFEVVLNVCEQRMRRLTLESFDGRQDNEWNAQSPRQLVAEAIVQELLVSLLELRMKEKETSMIHEVEDVEIMRQLHGHLQRDEEVVRNKVCIGAGDEQQLNQLQLMLRTDFFQEVMSVESPQKNQQVDSAANKEASLQFAWETIHDQKEEIIRLRAKNESLQKRKLYGNTFSSSFLQKDSGKVFNVLRSQLSSHQVENLDILYNYIQQLEKALQSAPASSRKTRRKWDGSKSMVDSSRNSGMLLSRSAIDTDSTRSQVHSNRCEGCREYPASLLALQSQLEQFRAQADRDKTFLLQADKDRSRFQQENATLSSELLAAKQKQEELDQTTLKLTQEKHELQHSSNSEQRTFMCTLHTLQVQTEALQEQKSHVKHEFDDLKSRYDVEVSAKQAIARDLNELQNIYKNESQSAKELQLQVEKLHESEQRWKALAQDRDVALQDAHASANILNDEIAAQAIKLQEKDMLIAEMKTRLSEFQRRFHVLEAEKCRAAGEVERLLETLDECKRKNQRLEKGFEELQQGKELLISLQQVEKEASVLHEDELKQMREAFEISKAEHLATRSECVQLEKLLVDAKEARLASDNGHIADMKRMQQECDAMTLKCATLEQNLKQQEEIQRTMESTQNEHCARAIVLSKEVVEAKTAMQMWMNEYNALRKDKQILDNHVQSLCEEQCRLQRIINELYANREVNSQEEDEKELTLKNQVSSLTEQHRAMEREHRCIENEKRTLLQLVQTLQARPELQQRVLREMIVACQRGTERMLCRLSNQVEVTLKKLIAAEQQFETLQSFLTKHKLGCGTITEGDNAALPQIVVHEDAFSSSSVFGLSTSQPAWLEAIAPSNTFGIDDSCKQGIVPTQLASTIAALELQLKQWKWKYFVKCLATNSIKQDYDDLVAQLKQSVSAVDQSKQTARMFTWHKFTTMLVIRQLEKRQHVSLVIARQLLKELQRSKQSQCFAKWRFLVEVDRSLANSRTGTNNPLQPYISPTLVMALANCIQLIRSFCEPPKKAAEGCQQAKSLHDYGADNLTYYLNEIKTKVASWKVAVDSRNAEYVKQGNQLSVLQRKCADLKGLAGLNQRLIEEAERRSAGQQNVIEAAWDFAAAYQALSPSARAQVYQSRDLLSASKGIVQGLTSLGIPRSVHKLSQTLAPKSMHKVHDNPATYKKVNFFSASAAPSVKTSTDSLKKEQDRKRLNDANIKLLEEAVCSLKGVLQQKRILQVKLKEKERSLTITTKELRKRNLQFLVLKSFLLWKSAYSNGPIL